MKTNIHPSNRLPVLSIIVPSFNQVAYLEETLQSILSQDYPALELIVVDGGSTDGSVDIIRKYETQIAWWVSEPDRGQSHAINKGLKKANGEWVAWMNSDDCYLPGGLRWLFNSIPTERYDFLYGYCHVGPTAAEAQPHVLKTDARSTLLGLLLFFHSTEYIIPSQSVFIRRSILEQAGLLDESLHYVMDLDWYARIYLHTSRRYCYRQSISFFRINGQTKSGKGQEAMKQEALIVADRYAHLLNPAGRWLLKKIMHRHDLFVQDYLSARSVRDWWQLVWQYPAHSFYKRHILPQFIKSLFRKKTISTA